MVSFHVSFKQNSGERLRATFTFLEVDTFTASSAFVTQPRVKGPQTFLMPIRTASAISRIVPDFTDFVNSGLPIQWPDKGFKENYVEKVVGSAL